MKLAVSKISDEKVLTKRPDSKKMRDAIFKLEEQVLKMPQAELEYIHRFTPGMYAREMIVPEGVIITGAIHKTEHISIFLEGRMLIPVNGGSTEISGPMVEIANPGVKRVGVALERVRWITMHPTNETDIETLEDMLWTNNPDEAQIYIDRHDYESLDIDESINEEFAKIEVHSGDVDGLEIRESPIHGKGLFVTGFVAHGEIIAPAVQSGKLYEYSRYTNHSESCNARIDVHDGDVNLVAVRDIDNQEVTIDYRTTYLRGQ